MGLKMLTFFFAVHVDGREPVAWRHTNNGGGNEAALLQCVTECVTECVSIFADPSRLTTPTHPHPHQPLSLASLGLLVQSATLPPSSSQPPCPPSVVLREIERSSLNKLEFVGRV